MRRWAAFRSTGYLPPLRWASDPVRHADGASLATASVCGLTSHSGAVASWSAARWVGGPRKQLCPWHGKASPPQCAASHSKGSHWSHCPITGTAASPLQGMRDGQRWPVRRAAAARAGWHTRARCAAMRRLRCCTTGWGGMQDAAIWHRTLRMRGLCAAQKTTCRPWNGTEVRP